MQNKGFTLIELSIVIVIIGLIVAGVVGGQSLVKQSKLRAVISEVNKYRVAINSFKLEYNALPGDMVNAQDYFGVNVTNGNGNKLIGLGGITDLESYGAFEHLSEAKLIKSSFTGVGPTAIGVNSPKSPYSGDTTFYFYNGNLWNKYRRGNSLVLSGANGWSDYSVDISDAHSIDKKVDDGLPYLGRVVTYSDIDGDCVASGQRLRSVTVTTKNSVQYAINQTDDLCTMHFGVNNYSFR